MESPSKQFSLLKWEKRINQNVWRDLLLKLFRVGGLDEEIDDLEVCLLLGDGLECSSGGLELFW
ncbi:hypothetical protein TorRG33x02_095110 [Trema orientale]|uniref:Uncharacterized protein n=1 Tax=Trema orientale TaxID=63057 RepID=A0A2P5FAB2_TREOI|nr:hypothetical protein TorRG33x02_095110 [Trema orientale]